MNTLNKTLNTIILTTAIGLTSIIGQPTPCYGQEIAKTETTQEQTVKYGNHDHSEGFYDTTYTSPSDISNLETELNKHPTAIGYVRLSDLFFMDNQNEEAGKAARRAKEINPKEWKAYLNLGGYHQRKNEIDVAIGYAKKCVELCPENPRTHHELGIGYVWGKNYLNAKEAFQSALLIDSTYQPSIRAMAKLSGLMGQNP